MLLVVVLEMVIGGIQNESNWNVYQTVSFIAQSNNLYHQTTSDTLYDIKYFLVEHEINELKKEIAMDQANNQERWNALLDANPVHFATNITWAENITVVPEAELNTIPIVQVGGLWGTICADGIDEYTYRFLCSLAGPGYVPLKNVGAKLHERTETEFGKYPVLLNSIRCEENAESFLECTSDPMGFENCPSENDLQAFCGPVQFLGP